MRVSSALSVVCGAVALGAVLGCSGGESSTEEQTEETKAPAKAGGPGGPMKALLVAQAHFDTSAKPPRALPAKLVIWWTDGEHWWSEEVLDGESNVFHKAMPWRDGILTIAGDRAMLKHWKREGDSWKSETLWVKEWGGDYSRLRDIEIGNVDGVDGDELVLATHDQGVVAVGHDNGGEWTFVEMDQTPDTFVHEIEIGDVDGDGRNEFYATASDRNHPSGVSQEGGVVRYDHSDGGYVRSRVVEWPDTHAKEILVADTDGDGIDELYVAREAVTKKSPTGEGVTIVEPVKVLQMIKDGTSWKTCVVATLDDQQLRFLITGDVDGDGQLELVAPGYRSGLWVLQVGEDADGCKTFVPELVDAESGGFEHAAHAADLDGDGTLEIYVASDDHDELRRYEHDGSGYSRSVVWKMPPDHLTWSIQDAELLR